MQQINHFVQIDTIKIDYIDTPITRSGGQVTGWRKWLGQGRHTG